MPTIDEALGLSHHRSRSSIITIKFLREKFELPASLTDAEVLEEIHRDTVHRRYLAMERAYGTTQEKQLFAAAPWLEAEIGLLGEVEGLRTKIAQALGLSADATKADVVARINDVFDVLDAADAKNVAVAIFTARVAFAREGDPKLSVAAAQAAVASDDPDLFAATRVA